MSGAVIGVALGEYVVGRGNDGSDEQWAIFGLGSCVGLILYDPISRVSGLAHIVLPQSPDGIIDPDEPVRYADLAVPFLVGEVVRHGGNRLGLLAIMAGGARVVDRLGDIGARNIDAVRKALAKAQIPVVAERLGGTVGYTLRWDPSRAQAWVRQAGGKEELLAPVATAIREVDLDGTGAGC